MAVEVGARKGVWEFGYFQHSVWQEGEPCLHDCDYLAVCPLQGTT